MMPLDQARTNMVLQQIAPWNIFDRRVLDALQRIPREAFVPEPYLGVCYADFEIPIAPGRAMQAPPMVARFLQSLSLTPNDKVLEIGAGRGYLTAGLCQLARQVISTEADAGLCALTAQTLQELGIHNVKCLHLDALRSAVEGGPFDAIACAIAVDSPAALTPLREQLKPRGRLVAQLHQQGLLETRLITRLDARHYREELLFEQPQSHHQPVTPPPFTF